LSSKLLPCGGNTRAGSEGRDSVIHFGIVQIFTWGREYSISTRSL